MCKISCFLLVIFCCACTEKRVCDPVWDVPSPAMQEQQQEAYSSSSFAPGLWPEQRWWTQFEDSQLEHLILKGLILNPQISLADAETRLAAAQAGIVGSALKPKLELDGDVTRTHVSETGIFGVFPPGSFPYTYTQSEVYLSLQFEIDWWGKNRTALMSAIGEIRAREIESYAARISLGIQIAQAYYRYQVLQQRLALARVQVENRVETLELIGLRVKKNLSSQIDYNTAKSDLAISIAFLESLDQDSSTALNAIKALVAGQFDDEVCTVDLAYLADVVFPLPEDLPLDLIAHRPDITAQIWRADSAGKDIYVAKAQFYPNLNLLALAGFQTIIPGQLFKNKSKYGDVGPAIHLPILEGGALRANLSAKQEEYAIAVLDYENLVISAVQEVLDGIQHVRSWNERFFSLSEAAYASEQSYHLNQQRLNSRLNSKLDVLQAQKQWLADQDNALQAFGAGINSRLSLIKALGGGFETVLED